MKKIVIKIVNESSQAPNLPIVFAQKPNALALAGIWKNRKISPEQVESFQDSLRQRAWGDRL